MSEAAPILLLHPPDYRSALMLLLGYALPSAEKQRLSRKGLARSKQLKMHLLARGRAAAYRELGQRLGLLPPAAAPLPRDAAPLSAEERASLLALRAQLGRWVELEIRAALGEDPQPVAPQPQEERCDG